MVKAHGIMDPEDLLNDTLLAGLENYHKINKKEALLAWMFTTANRICLNQLRRKKFQGNYSPEFAATIPDATIHGDVQVDISFLYDAINQLPEVQREAIILFEISDLPIKEIMKIQQAKSSTVKQRLKRGREKLAALLNESENKKKIAVLVGLFIGGNAFGMSHINQLFQQVKDLPLPVSEGQALQTIQGFQGIGAAAQATAAKTGVAIVKKAILGVLVAGGITTGVWMTTSSSDSPKNHETPLVSSQDSKVNQPLTVNDLTAENAEKPADTSENQSPSNNIDVIIPSTVEKIQDSNIQLASINGSFPAAPPVQNNQNGSNLLEGDTYPLVSVETVKFDNFGDHLTLKTWNKNEVKIIENHIIEGKTEEDSEIIRRHMETKMKKEGGLLTFSQGGCQIKNVERSNRVSTIKFNDGEKARYKKMELRYTVMLPNTMNLHVNGHYASVSIPDVEADLFLHLFDGRLSLGDVRGKSTIKLHYSKAKTGNLADASIYLMEGSLEAGTIHTNDLTAKYAVVKTPELQLCGGDFLLFESQLSGQKISGQIPKGSVKYSSLKFDESDLEQITMNVFESHIQLSNIGEAELNMRYSKLTAKKIESLALPVAFESKFDIQSVGNVQAKSSKYSTYDVGQLKGDIDMVSFEDKLHIAQLDRAVRSVKLNGKYSVYDIQLSAPANYRLEYDGKYGQFDYSNYQLELTSYESKNDHNVIEGFLMGGNNDSPLIRIHCFESKVQLN
jgi:RNA polymerase sigma factor (sigma-70 family)